MFSTCVEYLSFNFYFSLRDRFNYDVEKFKTPTNSIVNFGFNNGNEYKQSHVFFVVLVSFFSLRCCHNTSQLRINCWKCLGLCVLITVQIGFKFGPFSIHFNQIIVFNCGGFMQIRRIELMNIISKINNINSQLMIHTFNSFWNSIKNRIYPLNWTHEKQRKRSWHYRQLHWLE